MDKITFPPVNEQLKALKRGTVDLVSEDQLRSKLERSRKEGKPLTIKTGFDPSSADLHLGHCVLMMKMHQFQLLGHRVVFLVGDFTARIGDPTGKKVTRPQLTEDEVLANAETYQTQAFKILDRDRTVVDYNNRWLGQLGSEGIIRLAGSYTLARIMERDDFRKRFASNQPIHLHELLYPLVQGYDSVAMKADVELGGHDQIFNLLVGRDLMKEDGLEPQVVLTVPLLVGLDGVEKMSKSLGNHIAVEDSPKEIYGKTMSLPDSLMWDWYLLLTKVSEEEIAAMKGEVSEGRLHPKKVKQRLARYIVSFLHHEEDAIAAETEFEKIFAQGGLPDNIPEVTLVGPPFTLPHTLARANLAKSNGEARRLIQQGAVALDGEKCIDPFFVVEPRPEPYLVKVGKRRFARITLES